MKKVVSFSGGRTSAYLCALMIEKFGRESVDFIFMDTGFEHPATYDFVKKVNDYFDLNLVCLRGDFSAPLGGGVGFNIVDINECKQDLVPFGEMMQKYGVPYYGGMFCTDRMKLKPFQKHCDIKYGKSSYETWLGIRRDEPSRIVGKDAYQRLKKSGIKDDDIVDIYNKYESYESNDFFGGMFVPMVDEYALENVYDDIKKAKEKNKNNGIRFLAEISDFKKQDVLNWWGEQHFDLGIDEWLGNCVFCPKKSNIKLAAAQRDEPEIYFKWLEAIHGDSVRVDSKTGHWSKMYRGKQSLESLIASFDGSTGKEIKSRLRGTKSTDTGSCSESCEVFSCGI